jgi:hypothetical protein
MTLIGFALIIASLYYTSRQMEKGLMVLNNKAVKRTIKPSAMQKTIKKKR